MPVFNNDFLDPLEVGQRPPVGIALWVWSDLFLLLAVLVTCAELLRFARTGQEGQGRIVNE
jgi:hypothetical protein